MPIQVKDYLWEEADESVLVTVPLKGVPPNRVDIFSIDDYIKVYSISHLYLSKLANIIIVMILLLQLILLMECYL